MIPEYANLKLICDEIFGNYSETIVWQKRTSPDARKKLSSGHEYILIYTKNPDQNLGLRLLPLEGKVLKHMSIPIMIQEALGFLLPLLRLAIGLSVYP